MKEENNNLFDLDVNDLESIVIIDEPERKVVLEVLNSVTGADLVEGDNPHYVVVLKAIDKRKLDLLIDRWAVAKGNGFDILTIDKNEGLLLSFTIPHNDSIYLPMAGEEVVVRLSDSPRGFLVVSYSLSTHKRIENRFNPHEVGEAVEVRHN